MKNFSKLFLYFSILLILALISCRRNFSTPSDNIQPQVKDITVDEAKDLINSDKSLIILDVRTPSEFSSGHIANALNINYYSGTFSTDIGTLFHNLKYLVYCRSGSRSKNAVVIMEEKGFKTLYNMLGGFNQWVDKGYPVAH